MLFITEKVTNLINNYRDACHKKDGLTQVITRTKLEEYIARYKRALESLTVGGSEFADDPEYCKTHIESRIRLTEKVAAKLIENDVKALVKSVLSIGSILPDDTPDKSSVIYGAPDSRQWSEIFLQAKKLSDRYMKEEKELVSQS